MSRLRCISKGVTERIWIYNPDVQEFKVKKYNLASGLLEDVSSGNMIRYMTSNLVYADIQFNDEGWFVITTSDERDFLIYKVGSPGKDVVFIYSTALSLDVEIYDSTANFLSNISGEKLTQNLFVLDVSLLGNGEFLVYIKGDFSKIKLPFTKDTANYNPLNKKIILKPGFNMVAWQGSGYGTFADKTSVDVSTVSNYIADQLNSKYGSNSWRGCRTYDEVNGRFLDYINGLTPSTAEGNFQLIIEMNGNKQIEGFEIYTLVPYDLELECG